MRSAEILRYLVLAAQREGNRSLGQALRRLGVTPSQAEVIRVLQERAPLTLNGLGELLVCESGSSPSRLVDRLAAAGLVYRRVSEHDRRQVELGLTAEGGRLAEEIAGVEEDLYRALDDAARGHDVGEVVGFLRAFVANTPAGAALARRIDTSPSPHETTEER